MPKLHETSQDTTKLDGAAAEQALQEWRGRIDELRLQLDLAAMDVRDQLRERIDVAENAYLAARSGLGEAGRDTADALAAGRLAVEQLLRDLERAYQSAEAVVRRASD
ncbi:MAG: hypothetical protein ACP5P9_02725 [Acidimicrobiales bacterium]